MRYTKNCAYKKTCSCKCVSKQKRKDHKAMLKRSWKKKTQLNSRLAK